MKAKLKRVEFYITNVCNFNCSNCNRLNNYYFSGHQYWKDHAKEYEQWSAKLELGRITILGGEPLLNPDLMNWISGIRFLWPNSTMDIVTNGTRLEYWPSLYQVMLKNNIELIINAHNRLRYNDIFNSIEKFLTGPISKIYDDDTKNWHTAYNAVRDPSWPECASANDFNRLPDYIKEECRTVHKIDPENYIKLTNGLNFLDANGVKVRLVYSENFSTAPLLDTGDGRFAVYNSNPTEAHEACLSKNCHHFVRGKLYKCHHVVLLPDFMKQFNVDISDDDRLLLESYRPMTSDQNFDVITKFLNNLGNEIPQCKLCPSKLEDHFLQSSNNKPKRPKRTIKIHQN